MPVENIGEVIRFGMEYERTRVETAAHNLAVANMPLQPGAPGFAQRVVATVSPAGVPEVDVQAVRLTDARTVHDPAHPMADAAGMVSYPAVEPAMEMATLVSATRAYEANVRAYNTLRAMNLKAFEIGKN